MNKETIIKNMIEFIEQKEQEIQNNKMISEGYQKKDIVNMIIDELEKEIKNEN